MAEHNIRVVVLLNSLEYMSMQSMADEDGLSDSAFMRRLLKLEANTRAMNRVSAGIRPGESTEAAQDLHK